MMMHCGPPRVGLRCLPVALLALPGHFVHGTKGQAFDVDGQSLPGRFVDHASPKLAEHVCAHVTKPRVYGMTRSKRLAAEFVGTFWLVPAGCGSAAVLAADPRPGIRLCRNLARETLNP